MSKITKEYFGTLNLFAAAPDLAEAIISAAKMRAFDLKNYSLGTIKAMDYADEHWPAHLTTKERAALTKAGILK